ncbi:MAG: hypothetical protein B7C24_15625 [Bacteroidetes bacterium 4572_77]|nr:MAG: hypothetical protein B7C24_15625 [Bacteroidetes bacterium 4572_77]
MHKRTLLFLSLILALQTKAIHDPKTIGARSLGMGNIGVVGSDFNSVFNNQAALAYFQNTAFGINYDQGFFADKNLSTKTAAFVASTKLGGIGLNFSHFGYAQYQTHWFSLWKSFGEKISHWCATQLFSHGYWRRLWTSTCP